MFSCFCTILLISGLPVPRSGVKSRAPREGGFLYSYINLPLEKVRKITSCYIIPRSPDIYLFLVCFHVFVFGLTEAGRGGGGGGRWAKAAAMYADHLAYFYSLYVFLAGSLIIIKGCNLVQND